MAATMYPTTTAGSKVHLMGDSILPSGVAFGLQKNCQLKPYFVKVIQRLIETGIVDYHQLQFDKKMENEIQKQQTNSLTSFSLHRLEGGFLLLIIGVVISAMIFSGEIVYNIIKIRRIKQRLHMNRVFDVQARTLQVVLFFVATIPFW